MKSAAFCFATALAFGVLALSQTAGRPAPNKATTPGNASKKSSSGSPASRKGRPSSRARNAPVYRQASPTPERYKEIQQALVDRGYLKVEPNGVWDAQSSDALKQFQTDKNLTPTGKITAASLIGLGLGPKPTDNATAAGAADAAANAPSSPGPGKSN